MALRRGREAFGHPVLAGLAQPPLGQESVRHEEQGLRRRRGEPLRGVGRVAGLTVVVDLEPAGQHLRAQADELRPVGVGQDAGAATARREDRPSPSRCTSTKRGSAENPCS